MATADRPSGNGRYHSPLRARQAAQTRRAILDAATSLFRDRGWAATTIPMIAEAAGTSVDAIYSRFATKSGLLMAVVDVAIVGDDEEAAMVDRPDFALLGKGRTLERVRAGVRFTLAVYRRSVPMLNALREAAASDDAARARLAQYDEDRRRVTAAGLALILAAEPPDAVIDAIWALISPETFTYLTEGRHWSLAETEDWLVRMSLTALKEPQPQAEPRQ
ncbi:TetR/AcrR family transcriptional regulator [Rathayibacter soli]|uniref:TetR/AcrR family transcriptional regulator n=1 Tax=Rathayibacter soli TaxID=3144168 RepID=UPI0027E3C8AF|nr:helix-turn-helix domain-containing protein [Glaciibacter superstes]